MSQVSWIPDSDGERVEVKLADWFAPAEGKRCRSMFGKKKEEPEVPPEPEAPSEPPSEPFVAMPPIEPPPVEVSHPSAELTEEYEQGLSLVSAALEEISLASEREERKMTAQAVELGLAMAAEFAAGVIDVEPARALALAKDAMTILGGEHVLTVRLQPDLYTRLADAGLLEELKANSRVVLRSDPTVEDRGCIVESTFGRVDARVSSRLRRARALVGSSFGGDE